jgi:hypothetical protein
MLEDGFGTHLLMITKLFHELFSTTGYVVARFVGNSVSQHHLVSECSWRSISWRHRNHVAGITRMICVIIRSRSLELWKKQGSAVML